MFVGWLFCVIYDCLVCVIGIVGKVWSGFIIVWKVCWCLL